MTIIRICAAGRWLVNPGWAGWTVPCDSEIAYWTRLRDGRKRVTIFFCLKHKLDLADQLGPSRFRPV